MPFEIEIRQSGQPPKKVLLESGVYPIGRADGCRIRLRHPHVSDRHALLILEPDHCTIEDLGSKNGTTLNDAPIRNAHPVSDRDVIQLGPYRFTIRQPIPEAGTPPSAVAPQRDPAPGDLPPSPVPGANPPAPSVKVTAETPPSPAGRPGENDGERTVVRQIKSRIHRELIQRLDLRRLSAARVNSEELQRRARETLDTILKEVRDRLPAGMRAEEIGRQIYNEALRLGPLEDFLAEDAITEIMVNGPHQVVVEREGKLHLTDQDFIDEASVLAIIERIVAPLGRRIDESQPYVDARLPDGSRVNAIIAPLSLTGPCLTIRKFSRHPFADADLVRFGTLSPEIAAFMRVCVRMRKNIVVSGGTGSGKTTLLNVLSTFLPDDERIVTIEDAAELRLGKPHLVRLEARPPNIEGRGAITIRDLVRNALRMRPDRIIVGECRGGEALDMLQAMNTGHDGSLTTIHANAPRDVIARLETMVLMSGMDLPSRAIREQIAAAIDIIIHESRFSDGSRKVVSVTEIVGLEGNQITMQDLFAYRQSGINEQGRITGGFEATGAMPTFFQDLKARGMTLDPTIFKPTPRTREFPA